MGDPVTELATRLPCTFGILTELSAADVEELEIEPGEKLCITTSLARDSYVYLFQIELVRTVETTNTTVWVMFPDDPGAEPLRAAERVRVPPVDGWMEPVATGKVRSFMASRPLLAEDIRRLLDGREPLAGTVTIKNAKTGASWP